MKKSLLLSMAVILFAVPQLSADVLVNENFNRPDGSLVGSSPTPGPGGVWSNFSGVPGDLLISSGRAVVQHGVPSEDAQTAFADQTTGILSAVFDVTVNDDTVIAGGDFEYFAFFNDGGTGTNFYSRLDIVAANVAAAGNDFTFGIATNSSVAEATFATDFTFGTTYNGTLTYNFGTQLSTFTIGAATITSTTLATPSNPLISFALRQSDSSNNETVFIDNLMVSNNAVAVPEPGSIAVLGLIGLVGLSQRRRK